MIADDVISRLDRGVAERYQLAPSQLEALRRALFDSSSLHAELAALIDLACALDTQLASPTAARQLVSVVTEYVPQLRRARGAREARARRFAALGGPPMFVAPRTTERTFRAPTPAVVRP